MIAMSSMYGSQEFEEAHASQKECGSPKLVVKNTFIGVEKNALGMLGLRRAATAPPLHEAPLDVDSDSDREPELTSPVGASAGGGCCVAFSTDCPENYAMLEDPDSESDHDEFFLRSNSKNAQLEAASNSVSCVPPPSLLCRYQTFDPFDHWDGEEAPIVTCHMLADPAISGMSHLMTNPSDVANEHLEDVHAVQADDSSLKLVVKNTFIGVDKQTPLMLGLGRASTAPPLYGAPLDDSDREEEQQATLVPSSGDSTCVASHVVSVAPTPSALCRDQTFDFFEHWEDLEAPIDDAGVSSPHAQESHVAPLSPEFETHPYSNQLQPNLMCEVANQPSHVQSGPWEVLVAAPQPFQPQTLSQWRNNTTGSTCICWTVDGRKLRSNDRLTVSPLFALSDGHVDAPPLPFKMIISPKVASDGKGGASFRKANGRAIIQLKCEAPREELESYPISFFLSACSGNQQDPRLQAARGPVTCNFAQTGVCGLPKDCETWDFLDVVDEQTRTFVVCLEVLGTLHPPQSQH